MAPEKGDRVVWWDAEGRCWREHKVVRIDEATGGCCHVYAASSRCGLLRDYVEEAQLVSKTAEQAMRAVPTGTRWRLGYTA